MTNEELTALCKKQEERIKSLEYTNKMLWTMIDITIEAWKTHPLIIVKEQSKNDK